MPHTEDERGSLNEVGGHCPKCLAEYRPGFTTCSDCDVPLVPGPALSDVEAVPEGVDAWADANARVWGGAPTARDGDGAREREVAELARLCSLPHDEAWLMAGRLRADGIPAVVYPEDFSANVRFRRYLFDVIVRRDQLERAREIAGRYVTL